MLQDAFDAPHLGVEGVPAVMQPIAAPIVYIAQERGTGHVRSFVGDISPPPVPGTKWAAASLVDVDGAQIAYVHTATPPLWRNASLMALQPTPLYIGLDHHGPRSPPPTQSSAKALRSPPPPRAPMSKTHAGKEKSTQGTDEAPGGGSEEEEGEEGGNCVNKCDVNTSRANVWNPAAPEKRRACHIVPAPPPPNRLQALQPRARDASGAYTRTPAPHIKTRHHALTPEEHQTKSSSSTSRLPVCDQREGARPESRGSNDALVLVCNVHTTPAGRSITRADSSRTHHLDRIPLAYKDDSEDEQHHHVRSVRAGVGERCVAKEETATKMYIPRSSEVPMPAGRQGSGREGSESVSCLVRQDCAKKRE
ncbi:hypothetical protein C8F04DRAFT_1274396 [Mycena alexandri]|uniref:Uncharacterized protein n=1 Tax=Mycena alexandri TaxID=1745969 RepID=A0AAD6S4Z8_9AGAR|nr:hypothetical protein C8F04DRAFT_1274396 [Mycena alexandri]